MNDLTLDQIKTLVKQNKVSASEIIEFCNNNKIRNNICYENQDEIWTLLLQRDYPQFPLVGSPKEQYQKIDSKLGQDYFIGLDEYQSGSRYLHTEKSKNKVNWKVKILGNNLLEGTKITLALFEPESLPDIEHNIILPASAYNSFEDAKADICNQFGKCIGKIDKGTSLKFKPDFKSVKLVPGTFLYEVADIYAKNKHLKVILDEFVITYTDSVDPHINKSKGSQTVEIEKLSVKESQSPVTPLTQNEVTGGLRTPESYTHTLNKVLEVVTIQKGTLPVGSFKYNIHKYPGDVDIFEKVDTCCTLDDAKDRIVTELQQMIKRVKASQDIYLGDFKAGKDERFEINIGSWSEPSLDGDMSLTGYNYKTVRREVQELHDEKLISDDEFSHFKTLIIENPSFDEWQDLSDTLREYTVLRWTGNDILQGFLILPGSEKLMLRDALAQGTLVKIDVWARINSRYMEVTNFFMLTASDNKGKKLVQLTQPLPDYEKSISRDVIFYSSEEHRKTLKALKRLWSLALFRDDFELAAKISPLFASTVAALHQINGEAEVLAMMLRKLNDPPLVQIMEQIDGFKPRIDQLNPIAEKNHELFALVNNIVDPYYKDPSNYDKFEEAAVGLDQLQKILGGIVEQTIYQEAKEAGLEHPTDFL